MKNNNEEKVVIQVKEKKVYNYDHLSRANITITTSSANKNDMYQKGSVDYLRNQMIKSALFTYNREKPTDKELKKFIAYVNKRVKPNNSKNDLNYRIESLYNYIITLYSDFIEISNIVNELEVNQEQN